MKPSKEKIEQWIYLDVFDGDVVDALKELLELRERFDTLYTMPASGWDRFGDTRSRGLVLLCGGPADGEYRGTIPETSFQVTWKNLGGKYAFSGTCVRDNAFEAASPVRIFIFIKEQS